MNYEEEDTSETQSTVSPGTFMDVETTALEIAAFYNGLLEEDVGFSVAESLTDTLLQYFLQKTIAPPKSGEDV
jgi:hypothetical protein